MLLSIRGLCHLLGAATLASTALAGCTPASPFRYSALVPAARPISWDGKAAKDGTARIEGSIAKGSVVENETPILHDTAVWVPHTTIEANAALAVGPGVEVGGRFAYSSFDWSDPSALGTMPMPKHPAITGYGPELRATIPLDPRRRWAIGFAGNLMQYRIPITQWTKVSACLPGDICATDTSTTTGLGGTTYKLTEERVDPMWVYNVGLYPSLSFGDHGELGHLVGVLAMHLGFKNDGFTDSTSTKGAVEGAGPILTMGAGYGIAFHPVHASVLLFTPLTSSHAPVRYGLGGVLTVGFDLELWESEEERYLRRASHGAPH
jgi:hypothetical protein